MTEVKRGEQFNNWEETLLTSLAVAEPEPMSVQQFCENVGMCDEKSKADLVGLVAKGYVQVEPQERYRLTQTGQLYIQENFEISRNGEITTVTRRESSR